MFKNHFFREFKEKLINRSCLFPGDFRFLFSLLLFFFMFYDCLLTHRTPLSHSSRRNWENGSRSAEPASQDVALGRLRPAGPVLEAAAAQALGLVLSGQPCHTCCPVQEVVSSPSPEGLPETGHSLAGNRGTQCWTEAVTRTLSLHVSPPHPSFHPDKAKAEKEEREWEEEKEEGGEG